MYLHHTIEYPDGTVHRGKLDHRPNIDLFGLSEENVGGKRVLDVATNDGVFAFWAEQFGKAADVVAIDVDGYDGYDWGPAGPPEDVGALQQQDKSEAFWFHHYNLGSKVTKKKASIYDLDSTWGQFDIVFNFGLIYHLRNPIGALDACRSVCSGVMFLETQVMPRDSMLPVYWDCGKNTGLLGITDHNWPTESCVASWLEKSGFRDVYIQSIPAEVRATRQRFVACVSDEWREFYARRTGWHRADGVYWERVRDATRIALEAR